LSVDAVEVRMSDPAFEAWKQRATGADILDVAATRSASSSSARGKSASGRARVAAATIALAFGRVNRFSTAGARTAATSSRW
jgi:hypothetical protein